MVGVAKWHHCFAMGPAPAWPTSVKERQVILNCPVISLSCFTVDPPTWTPTRAKGLSFSFVTSDRSCGHWLLHWSQTKLQKSSKTTFPR